MPLPFVDLKRQYEDLKPAIDERIHKVLEHGRYILGPEVGELEEALAKLAGTDFAIGCASGTDALVMALMALGIGPGDGVVTTPFTYVATAEAIALVGAKPLFVDIDERTYNIDPEEVRALLDRSAESLGARPRAIMPVDLFGLPADYASLREIARAHDLRLIGDGAQSFGSSLDGRPTATFADVWTTSFFPAKPLGCYGDGGAVFTSDPELAERLRSIRVHGSGKTKYENVRLGLNSRLDTLQAAVLLAKLPSFPDEIVTRNRVARAYTDRLRDLVVTPVHPDDRISAWAQYSIRSPRRAEIRRALGEAGIPTAVYYEIPLHLQPAFAYLGHRPGSMSRAEEAARTIVSLPMHPFVTDEQIETTTAIVERILRDARAMTH